MASGEDCASEGAMSESSRGRGAAPRVDVEAELLWKVKKLALGEDLKQFGPNGPPMNILEHCPVSDCLWVMAGLALHRLPVADVESLARRGPDAGARTFASLPLGHARANRLRCGAMAGQPVAVVVTEAGDVRVVPTTDDDLRVAASMKTGRRHKRVSTWGIAVAAHAGEASGGIVAVSANNGCAKAWLVDPRPDPRTGRQAWPVRPGGYDYCYTAAIKHEQNVPCIDIANGKLISASLDGTLRLAEFAASGGGIAAVGRGELPVFACDEALWGACWIPLRSVRTYSPASPPASQAAQWLSQGVALPEDILLTSVWPFLDTQTLARQVQPLSAAHARLLADEMEMRAEHRKELFAFCFSDTTAWLLDEDLQPCAMLELPFSATFAHIAYDRESSVVVMATKLCPEPSPAGALWAICLLRRKGSMRCHMEAHAIRYDFPESRLRPASAVLGMCVAPGGRVFSLLASRRLACHRLSVRMRE